MRFAWQGRDSANDVQGVPDNLTKIGMHRPLKPPEDCKILRCKVRIYNTSSFRGLLSQDIARKVGLKNECDIFRSQKKASQAES